MRKYFLYIVPVVFYFCVSMLGKLFTYQGVIDWYPTLIKPSYTPPGSVIAIVWTFIYLLSAISLILFARAGQGKPFFPSILGLYFVNGVINAAWSYIFFTKHMLGFAVIDAALIGITVALIIVFVWRYSKTSALLLIPYLVWVSFATYLTYDIYGLN